jgi:hypothetical protein
MSTSDAVVRHVTDMAKSLYCQAAAEADADKRARLAKAGARLEGWRVRHRPARPSASPAAGPG